MRVVILYIHILNFYAENRFDENAFKVTAKVYDLACTFNKEILLKNINFDNFNN